MLPKILSLAADILWFPILLPWVGLLTTTSFFGLPRPRGPAAILAEPLESAVDAAMAVLEDTYTFWTFTD